MSLFTITFYVILIITKPYFIVEGRNLMKLILCGGGSKEQNLHANAKLNELVAHTKPILYIPLAMNEKEHPYNGCLEWIHEELANVDVPNIEMVRTFEELVSKDYKNYSALFIGGGNTYKLLKGIKETGAFDKMKHYIENDGIVLGSSAGSVIFGKDINIISKMDSNDVTLKDTTGFDILNGFSIFPHYGNTKSSLTKQENIERMNMFTNYIIEYSKTIGDVIAIPEEDAIFINGNKIEIIGSKTYYTFTNGKMEAGESQVVVTKNNTVM